MPSIEREFRNMRPLEIVRSEEGTEEQYQVRGYATTFDDEYELYNDGEYIIKESIAPEAFRDTDMSDVVFQYNHTGRVFARTKNETLKLSTDGHGLLVDADLSKTSASRSLFEDIDAKLIDQMSFAFVVSTVERTTVEDTEARTYTVHRRITGIKKLYDVSAVDFPANPNTEISARSTIDGEIEMLKTERSLAQAKAEALAKLDSKSNEKED